MSTTKARELQIKWTKKGKPLYVVLGMYDRDFSKPFDKEHYEATKEWYRLKFNKELAN